MDAALSPIDPLALPPAILAYVARFSPGATYIICGASGFPCTIGSGSDLGGELIAIRKTWPAQIDAPVLAAAWWAVDLRSAQRVVTLALASDLRHATRDGPRFAVTLGEGSKAVCAAAQRLAIPLTEHATLLERAGGAISRIESGIAVAQLSGGLKFFNKAYAEHRRAAVAAGQDFMSYGVACRRLREALGTVASGAPVDNDYLLRSIFGSTARSWKQYPRR